MIRLLIALVSIVTFVCGCIGPFRKQPEPELVSKPIVIESPTISLDWDKIEKIFSDKEKVKTLLGPPDFIDKHKT